MIPRSLLVVAVVGAVVASLSGCSVPSAPASSSPAPEGASPTPAAEAQGDPLPTLPLACGDFFSERAASDLLFLPVTLKVSETAVRSTFVAAALQGGATRCIWGADDKTDNGWDQTIVLEVLPDGAQAFDTIFLRIDLAAADGLRASGIDDLGAGNQPFADSRAQVIDLHFIGDDSATTQRRATRKGQRIIGEITEHAAMHEPVLLLDLICNF